MEDLNEDDVVEITGGPFKGMRAKITRLDKAKGEVTLELLEATFTLPITVHSDYVKLVEKAKYIKLVKNMSEKKVVELLVNGGQANAGPPLGPALGPLGVNIMAIVNKINELTKDYAGMKVPVKISVDTEDKTFEVTVGTPTASALIVAELKIEKGSGTPNTVKVGNLSMEQMVRIAKIKRPELLAPTLKKATKEMLGTCVSLGVTVEGKDPREVQKDIDAGNYEQLFGSE